MDLLSKLYSKSPILFQNMFVSIYGLKLFYERYLGAKASRDELIRSQYDSEEIVMSAQLEKLKLLLNHANNSVPYYINLFSQIGFNPSDIRSVNDLVKLPVLKKETIRTQCDALVSKKYDKSKLIALNTSGSTGKSLKIFVDRESRRKAYSFTSRYHSWAGLDGTHNATFGGRIIVPQGQSATVYWRYNAAMQNYLFSTYHMSDATLPFYIKKLIEIKPEFIEAYPSAAYILARFIDEKKISGLSPKAILTSGETLFDHQRILIEKAFGCPVFDQYGCTEQALFVSQCECGTYHVHPEFGFVELLDDNDCPVGRGEVGRVVCTSFINQAMPLIRYDIGDLAEWGDGECNCRRHFPIIKKIIGRQDDVIKTPDGRTVGRLDPIFKGLTCIKAAQVIQTKTDEIVIKIVPSDGYTQKNGDNIRNELMQRVGLGVNISISIVDKIDGSGNGKFKSVLSQIKN